MIFIYGGIHEFYEAFLEALNAYTNPNWQHINFIGKYEFYNRWDMLDI